MNGAQLHLALNHLPVVLSSVSLGVLLWGWISKNAEIKKVGLTLVVACAVFAGVAFLTGEPAEEVLEQLPSFSKELVHEHEEAGEAVLIVSILAGLCALATLILNKFKPQLAHYSYLISLLLITLASVAFIRVSHLGGLISHEEIRPTTSQLNP